MMTLASIRLPLSLLKYSNFIELLKKLCVKIFLHAISVRTLLLGDRNIGEMCIIIPISIICQDPFRKNPGACDINPESVADASTVIVQRQSML